MSSSIEIKTTLEIELVCSRCNAVLKTTTAIRPNRIKIIPCETCRQYYINSKREKNESKIN